jgi:uncharacterized protein YjbI with pentapeptide repeats
VLRILVCCTVMVSLLVVSAEEPKKKYVMDWSDRDFTKRDFHGQNLANYNMENCIFFLGNLKEANLAGSNLRGADFNSASLDRADLSGCDLREMKFENASAQRAKFDNANLTGADIRRGSVARSSLIGANLSNVKGIADLSGADFTDADLRGANMQDSKDYSGTAIFKNAKYDRTTRWPRGFDYEKSGAVLVKEEEPK